MTPYLKEYKAHERLRKMEDNLFVVSAMEKRMPYEGTSPKLYFLGKEGYFALREHTELTDRDIPYWYKGGRKPAFDRHSLEVNDVRCALIRQAMESEDITVHTWFSDRQLANPELGLKLGLHATAEKGSKRQLIPDGVFWISEGDLAWECFLEVDRGTEDRPQWQDKIKRYLKLFDGSQGRLLLIVGREKDLEKLMGWTEEVGGRNSFWFAPLEDVTYQFGYRTVTSKGGNAYPKLEVVGESKALERTWRVIGDEGVYGFFPNHTREA